MAIPLLLARHPLARDIAIVIALKIVFIALASVYLFPASRRPLVNPDIVARKLFAAQPEEGAGHGR